MRTVIRRGVLGLAVWAAALTAQAAAQKIEPVPADRLQRIVESAPRPPERAPDLGLELRLIDYIDCTDPNDPHAFRDQTTSKVVTGPAGEYRVSAGHDHAFFSYGYRTQGRDKPVLILVEYPDDAQRRFVFLTHDSMRPADAHLSFSMENGVYTGYPNPTTDRMRYFTMINWPQDRWSPLLAMNYGRSGSRAAASRIWVYAVESFDPLEIDVPDAERGRRLGLFVPVGFLAKDHYFGWRSDESIEHLARYCNQIGVNRVTMMLYANQSWGGMVEVPAWDVPDDNGFLEQTLKQLDRVGGVKLNVGIVAEGMYGQVMVDGTPLDELPREEKRRALLKGFHQILDRYGDHESFGGFALSSMEAKGFYQDLADSGLLQEVVGHIKERRPDLEVLTYLGVPYLQTPYFMEKQAHGRTDGTPSFRDMVFRWERGEKGWEKLLGDQILSNWRSWGLGPEKMLRTEGLNVYDQRQPEDHRIVGAYRSEPRGMLSYDMAKSEYRSGLVDTRHAAILDFFDEGWIGLTAGHNFWFSKHWTAPSFNASGPMALDPWSTHMAHRDRLSISAGGWITKYTGMEAQTRRFARAFRSLPPGPLETVELDREIVTARWGRHDGTRYINLVNRIAFPVEVRVGDRTVTLRRNGMRTLKDGAAGAPEVSAEVPRAFKRWVRDRLDRYRALYSRVREADPEAAPDRYRRVHQEAVSMAEAGRWHEADDALAYGLEAELKLRDRLLNPPELRVPRINSPPAELTDLRAWPVEANTVIVDSGSNIQSHTYFPNSWSGPSDVSFEMRLAHDGETLYFAVWVRDNKRREGDVCQFWFSDAGYRDWRPAQVGPDRRWSFHAPRDDQIDEGGLSGGGSYTVRPTREGYLITGRAPLGQLDWQPGAPMGFFVSLTDMDGSPTIDDRKSWAKQQVMHWPYKPNFAMWNDIRNAGELVLE